ncbi:hypothetical protein NMY22_g5229 [Coprinellus aureogranulatus]|nr:hypothetical protein NMY22_g5229 [Coprinellus aureogranulatus]
MARTNSSPVHSGGLRHEPLSRSTSKDAKSALNGNTINTPDLVTQLPKSNGFDAIAVFTDHFSKMIHALPCTSDINSEGVADLFYRKIFRLHGLPLGVTSDRGPQQTKRANQEVEKYLRLHASQRQDNWDQHLPMAEFVVNSRVHSAHSRSPFEVIYGHLPHFNIPVAPKLGIRSIDKRLQQLQNVLKEVEATLRFDKARQKLDYETGKRTAHSFQVNDYVWLSAKNIAIKVPTCKLGDLYLGPFKITEKVGDLDYRLQLPDPLSRLHPVFHIDKLYPWKGSDINGILPPPPDPIELDGEEEWEVQEVLDSRWTEHHTRKRGRKKANIVKELQYLGCSLSRSDLRSAALPLAVSAPIARAFATLTAPYFIGQSQNNPVSLTSFLTTHRYDPTTTKFLAKLKAHLLPRIRNALLKEARADPETYGYALPVLEQLVREDPSACSEVSLLDRDRIFIDKDRLYRHEILNVNFTSYEGRREQDILNPKTSRRDFMCLIDQDVTEATSPRHRFCYARLLGVYHANVVYTGRGSLDRKARRFDVLWIRWFKETEDEKAWSENRLDHLCFHSLDEPNAVDFLDPTHVLRASHIIPRFASGRVEDRTPEYAPLSKASEDWVEYVVNRFVDRDMLMRYHWGLGVGHLYSHVDAPKAPLPETRNEAKDDDDSTDKIQEDGPGAGGDPLEQIVEEEHDSDGSEYALHDRENEIVGDPSDAEGSDGGADACDGIPEPDE